MHVLELLFSFLFLFTSFLLGTAEDFGMMGMMLLDDTTYSLSLREPASL
jgi:hypothetical protein